MKTALAAPENPERLYWLWRFRVALERGQEP